MNIPSDPQDEGSSRMQHTLTATAKSSFQNLLRDAAIVLRLSYSTWSNHNVIAVEPR